MLVRPKNSSGDHTLPSRRRLLQLAGGGCLAFSLPACLQTQVARAASASHIKSCVLIFYYGGPSHLDTYDLKPDAPAEVRGEFGGIATSAAGVQVCEHLPRTSRVMHKLAVVRSVHHPMRNHNSAAVEALCGRTPSRATWNCWPTIRRSISPATAPP